MDAGQWVSLIISSIALVVSVLAYLGSMKKNIIEVAPLFRMAGTNANGIDGTTNKRVFMVSITNEGFDYFSDLKVMWHGDKGTTVNKYSIVDNPGRNNESEPDDYGEVMIFLDTLENKSSGYLSLEGVDIYNRPFKYKTNTFNFSGGNLTVESKLLNANAFLKKLK